MEGGERIRADFADIWRRSRPEIEERVEMIAGAVEALGEGRLDPQQSATAIVAAHKLAGVLGTFGLNRGSELAARLEAGLEAPGDAVGLGETAEELAGLVAAAAALPDPAQP